MASFDKTIALKYLGLPSDYSPDPSESPAEFLGKHLNQLPPHILVQFGSIISPQNRTVIPRIRNRRLKYTTKKPTNLSFGAARNTWPELWQGRERRGIEEGRDEKRWGEKDFLSGGKQHVGKLGGLLGEYEEEREAERVRAIRRNVTDDFIPEEEDDSEEEDDEPQPVTEEESPEEARMSFERLIKERFIYGLLHGFEYDEVDWDENLDEDDDREAEDRWFDDDDE